IPEEASENYGLRYGTQITRVGIHRLNALHQACKGTLRSLTSDLCGCRSTNQFLTFLGCAIPPRTRSCSWVRHYEVLSNQFTNTSGHLGGSELQFFGHDISVEPGPKSPQEISESFGFQTGDQSTGLDLHRHDRASIRAAKS